MVKRKTCVRRKRRTDIQRKKCTQMKHTSHKDCIVSWNSYKASALRGNVVQQIEAASADEIRQRREYM